MCVVNSSVEWKYVLHTKQRRGTLSWAAAIPTGSEPSPKNKLNVYYNSERNERNLIPS